MTATVITISIMSEEAVETVVSHEVMSIKSQISKTSSCPTLISFKIKIYSYLLKTKTDSILILWEFTCRFQRNNYFCGFKST